ncbi:MAG: hypothetical protein AAGK09_03635 [Planctomycetota bacterium]
MNLTTSTYTSMQDHTAEPRESTPRQVYSAFRLFQLAPIGMAAACLANSKDVAVAIAATVAWVALLIVLLATDSRSDIQHRRILVCLDSATLGSMVLLIGWLVDGISWPWLLASQAVMAVAFLTRWRRLGLSPAWAAAAWFGVLDGVYLIVWGVLFMGGVR